MPAGHRLVGRGHKAHGSQPGVSGARSGACRFLTFPLRFGTAAAARAATFNSQSTATAARASAGPSCEVTAPLPVARYTAATTAGAAAPSPASHKSVGAARLSSPGRSPYLATPGTKFTSNVDLRPVNRKPAVSTAARSTAPGASANAAAAQGLAPSVAGRQTWLGLGWALRGESDQRQHVVRPLDDQRVVIPQRVADELAQDFRRAAHSVSGLPSAKNSP